MCGMDNGETWCGRPARGHYSTRGRAELYPQISRITQIEDLGWIGGALRQHILQSLCCEPEAQLVVIPATANHRVPAPHHLLRRMCRRRAERLNRPEYFRLAHPSPEFGKRVGTEPCKWKAATKSASPVRKPHRVQDVPVVPQIETICIEAQPATRPMKAPSSPAVGMPSRADDALPDPAL